MSSLSLISAPENQLNGSLSPNMFNTLPNLELIAIAMNQISGPIPPSITNASVLLVIDISENHFTGKVPTSLGKLQDLQYLSLYRNNLGDNSTNDLEFLKSFTNHSKLQRVDVSYNNFGGHLPNFLGNLSIQLSLLHLGGNKISREIPESLGNGLALLTMEHNHIIGTIPTTSGKFLNMQVLDLNANMLSGEIGPFIGNLSQLFHLDMGKNMLEGNVPPSIGNCQKLEHLDLSQNNLTGTIPLGIFNLYLSNNHVEFVKKLIER